MKISHGLAVPLLAVIALLTVASPARAQDGPQWMPSLRKALEQSRERGTLVLIWCVGDDDSEEKADHAVLMNAKVRRAMVGYLVVLANPVDGHGKQNGTLDGKPAMVCRLAPGISCADHVRTWSEVYGAYADVMGDKNGSIKVPNHWVIDSDGKVLGTINNGSVTSGFSSVPADVMERDLIKILAKSGGPGLSDEALADFRKRIETARDLVSAGRMSEAARSLEPVTAVKKNLKVVQEARELLVKVEVKAGEAFGRAKGSLKEDPVGGLAGLEAVSRDFPGTEAARQASKEAEIFRASPAGKKALAELKRDEKGQEALEKALAVADAGGRDVDALRLLDGIARTYAGLPSGKAAAEKAAAIRSDPDRAAVVEKARQEKAAADALFAARGLIAGGKKDEARAALEKVVAEFPDTKAGAEAKTLLEELR